MPHLTESQLIALRDGVPVPTIAREHLATCGRCAKRLFELRRLLALRPSPLRSGRGAGEDEAAMLAESGLDDGVLPAEEPAERLLHTWTSAPRLRHAPAAGHPDPDELLALAVGSVRGPRATELQRHLSECDRCLALFDEIGREQERMEWVSPSRRTVAAAQEVMARKQPERIGYIVVERAGGALSLFLGPRVDPERAFVLRSAQPAARHAADASPRLHQQRAPTRETLERIDALLRRLQEHFARHSKPGVARTDTRTVYEPVEPGVMQMGEPPEASLANGAEAARDAARELERLSGALGESAWELRGLARTLRKSAEAASRPGTVTLSAGERLVMLAARLEEGECRIALTFSDAESLRPASGVAIRLEPSAGDAVDVVSDEQGRAEVRLPAGRSSLLIDSPSGYRVEFENPIES